MSFRRLQALTIVAACLALIVSAAACGSSPSAPSGQSSTTPTATPTLSGPPPSASASPSSSAHPTPAVVPTDFRAASVTFVSADAAFCLGTAPGHGTLLLRTLDRGQNWVRLTAPAAPLGRPGSGASSAVWGTRFASASHGFIFGDRLWETDDGGRHGRRPVRPPGRSSRWQQSTGRCSPWWRRAADPPGCFAGPWPAGPGARSPR